MTTPNHPTGQPSTAWQRHHATTEAAMHAYLATTHAAHRKYLTGPWPDRDAYNAVEVSAWMTYHARCRAAWQDYTDMSTCPCCTQGGSDCTCHSDCGAPRCQMADRPTAIRDPGPGYRPGGYLPDADSANPAFPEFHPKIERN